jgi:hypothetical protein
MGPCDPRQQNSGGQLRLSTFARCDKLTRITESPPKRQLRSSQLVHAHDHAIGFLSSHVTMSLFRSRGASPNWQGAA